MATTTSSTSGIKNLSSYYQSLINYNLEQEKRPLTSLTHKKDDVEIKKSVYTDLKTKFETLNNAIKTLRSTDTTFALKPGRAVSISSLDGDSTVASATVGSSVAVGTYKLSVATLAKAHEVRGIQQSYSDQDLGLTGTFVIGGAVNRSASISVAGSAVASIESNNANYIAAGQKEFGSGDYFLETRQDSGGVWQFRLVNTEGAAQNIQNRSNSEFTTDWQNIPVGETYDTGRGVKVTFGDNIIEPYVAANKDTGAVKINYAAKGQNIEVTADMSLAEIASLINDGTYGLGNEISASIINKTLVLTNQYTGASHIMAGADTSGNVLETLGITSGGALNTIVAASDAEFSINNMTMFRSSNTGLTDVVSGMTLSLASDAEGKTANIVVNSDNKDASATINTFLTALNDLTAYLRSKTTTTKNGDNTYSRGALVGESSLRYLSNELITIVNSDQINTGIYKNLAELGIGFNNDLSLTISDASKMSTALINHMSDVTKILDVSMNALSSKISTYVGTSGYINQSITTVESTLKTYNDRIGNMNERLTQREKSLVEQYQKIQARMQELSNQYSLNSTLYR